MAALLVGFIARLLGRWLRFLPGKLYPSVQAEISAEKKEDIWCITIERQYGCGGREIGKELAEQLGWAYYDSDLIRSAAGTTGLPEEFVEEKEEGMTGSLLFDLLHSMEGYGGQKAVPQDRIYQAESQAIREFAAKGNCVIVGRCGDLCFGRIPTACGCFCTDNRMFGLSGLPSGKGFPCSRQKKNSSGRTVGVGSTTVTTLTVFGERLPIII